MHTSDSFSELVNRMYGHSQKEGHRSYPAASFEISLLVQAQQRASRKEVALFNQFSELFNWNMSRRQRNAYGKKMETGFTLVLTDLTQTILWTSSNFLAMTGYSQVEIIGKSPSLLQGPRTDLATTLRMRESLGRAASVKADIMNYRKDGEAYLCRVQIDPLFDNQGELTHFLAVESELK